MPAIRFLNQCVFQIADAGPCPVPVDVRMRDGNFTRLHWLGMICEHAAEHLPGLGYAKVKAAEVTCESGLFPKGWVKLEKNEYVLAWRCEFAAGGKTVRQGVYGVVDKNLWPIIVGTKGRRYGGSALTLVKAS